MSEFQAQLVHQRLEYIMLLSCMYIQRSTVGILTMNVRIHTLFIVYHTYVLHYREYMSCSSRPSPSSVRRVAIEAKSTLRQCFWGAINWIDVFSCFGRFLLLFLYFIENLDNCIYNFEYCLLKSKTRTSVSLKVSNFEGCCNIEIALIQIKWKCCYRL